MLFDVNAALAEILNEGPTLATLATSATLGPEMPAVSRVSRVSQAAPAEVAQPRACAPPVGPATSRDEGDTLRHGHSFAGSPRTWTGRIVSLDEWRHLSAWDRHGPDGRLFCGLCRAWVAPGGCAQCNGGAA